MPIGEKSRKSKSAYKSTLTIYECEDCNDCKYKDKYNKICKNKLGVSFFIKDIA